MNGLLVIVSGPSGSGKSTVVKRLLPEAGYAHSVSVTTRPPRAGEVHGRDYFFVTIDEFHKLRTNGALLEHARYVGSFYGTPKDYVVEQVARGHTVVLEIEVMGALQVREKFPDAVLIFLIPPSMDDLSARLGTRGTEDASNTDARLRRALEEIRLVAHYDYIVVNTTIEQAVCAIDAIVATERMKPARCKNLIDDFLTKSHIQGG